jgi:hypothetical protein
VQASSEHVYLITAERPKHLADNYLVVYQYRTWADGNKYNCYWRHIVTPVFHGWLSYSLSERLLTGWLSHCQSDWPNERVTDSLTEWLIVYLSDGRSLAEWLSDRVITYCLRDSVRDWNTCWLKQKPLTGQPNSRRAGRSDGPKNTTRDVSSPSSC